MRYNENLKNASFMLKSSLQPHSQRRSTTFFSAPCYLLSFLHTPVSITLPLSIIETYLPENFALRQILTISLVVFHKSKNLYTLLEILLVEVCDISDFLVLRSDQLTVQSDFSPLSHFIYTYKKRRRTLLRDLSCETIQVQSGSVLLKETVVALQ